MCQRRSTPVETSFSVKKLIVVYFYVVQSIALKFKSEVQKFSELRERIETYKKLVILDAGFFGINFEFESFY